jgi:hypothetical protein
MSKSVTTSDRLTIGLELGDRFAEGRVLDAPGALANS